MSSQVRLPKLWVWRKVKKIMTRKAPWFFLSWPLPSTLCSKLVLYSPYTCAIVQQNHKFAMAAKPRRKKRVIVIGSGLAGLTAAYLIHNDPKCEYDVEIFESVLRLVPFILSISLLTKWADTGLPPITRCDNPPHKPRNRHSHADIFKKLL